VEGFVTTAFKRWFLACYWGIWTKQAAV